MSDELTAPAPVDPALAVVAPADPVIPAIESQDAPKKKLSELSSWDELVPAEPTAEVVAEAPVAAAPVTREDGATWDEAKGQWRRPDGTFAEGAAPELVAPVEAAEPVVEEEAPALEKVALRTRDGGTREIEVDDPELAELLRTNANDGMRAAQYREKVAALDAKLEEVNAFRAIMEVNPEAVVLQHMPAEKQVSIAVSLIAQHWDALLPAIQALDTNPADRIAAAMQAQASIRENQTLYEQKLTDGKYALAVQSQVQSLIPEGTPEATVTKFLSYAGQDLAEIIRRDGRVDPAKVPTLLADTVALFGFHADTAASQKDTPRAAVRFASAPSTPPVPAAQPTAARPVGDAAVKLAQQAQTRLASTQAARARAAAVPPSGAGAAPVRLPPVPKGADIRTASQTLKQMGNSWGHLTGS